MAQDLDGDGQSSAPPLALHALGSMRGGGGGGGGRLSPHPAPVAASTTRGQSLRTPFPGCAQDANNPRNEIISRTRLVT